MEHSRSNSTARKFAFGDHEIFWEHLYSAYHYDITTNSLQTHRHLTDDHFILTSTSKMRNHLADDVLGEEMLELVKVCLLVYTHPSRLKGHQKTLTNEHTPSSYRDLMVRHP